MYEICTLLSSFGQKMYGSKVLNILPFRFFGSFCFRDFLIIPYKLFHSFCSELNGEINEFFPDRTVFYDSKTRDAN